MSTNQNNPMEQAERLVLAMLIPGEAATTELIRTNAALVVTMLRAKDPAVLFDVDVLVRRIETLCSVWVPTETTLEDLHGHVDWLPQRRRGIDWRFWNRYRRYLEDSKRMAPQTVRRLDEITNRILGLIEDPNRDGPWDRRGMVVGQVQSGKTSNYTGLICKAADAGYPLIIVLAGLHNSLRSQTQIRLDEGFLGFDTQRRMDFHPTNSRMGVGLLPGAALYVAHPLTTSADAGDFNARVAEVGVMAGGRDPVLLVVKKNRSILHNLIRWATMVLQQEDPESGRMMVRDVPLLVIDDEADHASVNTRSIPLDESGRPDPEQDPSTINRLIRRLLSSFDKSSYIGYTATPFANIFIHRDADHAEVGEDLFPRSFIINLPTPSNYIGPVEVFGVRADETQGVEETPALPILRPVKDYRTWMPDGHKTHHRPGALPESLRRAIWSFILARASRLARGQTREHNSMLIHVTRFTAVQAIVAEQVREELDSIKRRLRYGSGGGEPLEERLRLVWEEDFVPTTASFDESDAARLTWEQVRTRLVDSVEPIEVLEINGSARDVLEYATKSGGFNVIAIGGDKLSRGLTLEGLSVSYYLRASRMYDTLMQMGRWFGYRSGYADLCRLYTTQQLMDWYRDIAAASEELRVEFDHMAQTGATPEQYGLRVRSHPDGLMITAGAKMRHTEEIELSFSQTISETIIFDVHDALVQKNFELTGRFLQRLDHTYQTRHGTEESRAERHLWHCVDGEDVAAFLELFETHPESRRARPDLLAAYIRARLERGELDLWTVVLVSRGGGTRYPIAGRDIGLLERSPFPEDQDLTERYSIRRLVSPTDEALDLGEAQRQEALTRTIAFWEANTDRRRSPTRPTVASGHFIREVRDRRAGLLLIYPLDPEKADRKGAVPFVGLAVSFPKADGASAIRYTVNNVYWEQEFGAV